MDTVIKLLTMTKVKDNRGVGRKSYTPSEVFARVRTVTRSEFFEGGRNGLNPEFQFTVFQGDYDGQAVIEYEGKRYAIYRTYISPGQDYIELYAQREGGVNAQED